MGGGYRDLTAYQKATGPKAARCGSGLSGWPAPASKEAVGPPAYYQSRVNPSTVSRENGLLGNNRQLDAYFNVGVQLKLDLVLASHPDRAFRQTNFALLYFGTTGSDRVSDVAHTDRTEQLAFFTGLGADGESGTLEGLGASLGSRQLLSSCFLKLGTTLFERLQVCFSGRYSLAIRKQEITTVNRP